MTDAHFRISTDPGLLDVELIHRWLSQESYWARGRARETLETAIGNSVNFGAYEAGSRQRGSDGRGSDGQGSDGQGSGRRGRGRQLGYARLVTDGATFGWLADVFVATEARGRGVGKALVRAVREEVGRLGLKRVLLATADAHGLYAGTGGFRPLAEPGRWMELGPGFDDARQPDDD